ncbi:hypothetical protein AB0M39_31720 [Streptomyces sp. NPDC051907]|uniref:RNA polymerase sigma factor n=1 Tax=Streptomyces sp. NPDC051907 TaxID=3155284 RepID=UPI003420836C
MQRDAFGLANVSSAHPAWASSTGERVQEVVHHLKLLALRQRWSVVGDTLVVERICQGSREALSVLVGRHQAAVCSYLSTCLTDHTTVEQATEETFRRVVEAAEREDMLLINRIRLLATARTVAVQICNDDPGVGVVAPEFQDWVASGGSWPLETPTALYDAFRCLPVRWQVALWHMTVDVDEPTLIGDVLGLPPSRVKLLGNKARHALRNFYLGAYERSVNYRPMCLAYARERTIFVAPAPGMTMAEHPSHCRTCSQADLDLCDLDGGLRLQLPSMLLGWWDDGRYRQMKALALRDGDPRPVARRVRGASR